MQFIFWILSDKDNTARFPLLRDSIEKELNHIVTNRPITDDTLKHNWKRRKKQTNSLKRYPGKVQSFSLL